MKKKHLITQPQGMGGQPHVHFESVPPGGGSAFENTHVIIVPRGD